LLNQFIFRSLLLILLLAGSPQCLPASRQNEGARAVDPAGNSGDYDPMQIGVDKKTGELTGFYASYTGWDEQRKAPRFSCVFYLYGKLQGDKYQITSWYPGHKEYLKGELQFVVVESRKEVQMKFEAELGGCWNVEPSYNDKDKKISLSLEEQGDWTSVRVVSAPKAFFHKGPNDEMRGKAYIVKGDPVRIFKVQEGWVDAEYRKTRGWIKEADLYSPYPNR